jgi:hypothetical protein
MRAHIGGNASCLGVVMLETRFPRPQGDIGNPASFAYPVRYQVVRGASPQRVIRERATGLLAPFIEAAQSLERAGCTAITTSCGFLALFQDEMARALEVPFAASSLLQLPLVAAGLPAGRRPGVVTISAAALTAEHLGGAGAEPDTPLEGVVADGEFVRAILGDQPALDTSLLESEVLEAGARLIARHPEIGAIVLECTNMPPYAKALRAASGLPVYDAITLADALMGLGDLADSLTSRMIRPAGS